MHVYAHVCLGMRDYGCGCLSSRTRACACSRSVWLQGARRWMMVKKAATATRQRRLLTWLLLILASCAHICYDVIAYLHTGRHTQKHRANTLINTQTNICM
jgi:hypothetical protein